MLDVPFIMTARTGIMHYICRLNHALCQPQHAYFQPHQNMVVAKFWKKTVYVYIFEVWTYRRDHPIWSEIEKLDLRISHRQFIWKSHCPSLIQNSDKSRNFNPTTCTLSNASRTMGGGVWAFLPAPSWTITLFWNRKVKFFKLNIIGFRGCL